MNNTSNLLINKINEANELYFNKNDKLINNNNQLIKQYINEQLKAIYTLIVQTIETFLFIIINFLNHQSSNFNNNIINNKNIIGAMVNWIK